MDLTDDVRTVAAVLFRQPVKDSLHSIDREAFKRAADLNRAPLGAIDLSKVENPLPPSIEQLIETENSKLARQETFLVPVLEAWANRGVTPLLTKWGGYFPYTSSNIDVLVAGGQFAEAVNAVLYLGYREVPHLWEPYKRFFKPLRNSEMPPIHLHQEIAWINVFISGEDVVRRGTIGKDNPLYLRPSASDVLLITIAHGVYEDKRITLRDLYHVDQALKFEIQRDYVREIPRRYGWEDGWRLGCGVIARTGSALGLARLDELADYAPSRPSRKGGRQLPQPIPKPYAKSLHFWKTWRDQTTSFPNKVTETGRLIWFATLVKSGPFRRSRSLVISISGPDGAGKTTVARCLTQDLSAFTIRAENRWLRLGSSRFLEVLKTPVVGRIPLDRRAPEVKAEAAATLLRHPWLKGVWCQCLLFDFVARAWIILLAARLRGGFCVLDRFTEDAAVDLVVRYGLRGRPFLLSVAPTADLSALLIAEPSVTSYRSTTPLPDAMGACSHSLYDSLRKRFDLTFDAGLMSSQQITQSIAESALLRLQAQRPPTALRERPARYGDGHGRTSNGTTM